MRALREKKIIEDKGSEKAAIKVFQVALQDLLVTGDARRRAMDKLLACLEATRSFTDIAGNVHTEPDWKTIQSACVALLAYTDGKPIERREVITKHFDSLDDYGDRLKKSPALRKAMGELLKESEEPKP